MQELIRVQKETIGNGEVNAVDGRELWEFLESKQKFTDWIGNRINKYGFVEGVDFISFHKFMKADNVNKTTKEYTISLTMAKELTMVETNDKGKQARKYFIACEEKLKQIVQAQLPKERSSWFIEGQDVRDMLLLTSAPESIANCEMFKHVHSIGGPDLRDVIGELPCSQNIADKDVYLEPTELGRACGLSAIKMNLKLAEIGFQAKDGKKWIPTDEGAEFCTRHMWNRGGKSGYNYKWNVNKVNEMINLHEVKK